MRRLPELIDRLAEGAVPRDEAALLRALPAFTAATTAAPTLALELELLGRCGITITADERAEGQAVKTRGRHLLVEYMGCDAVVLNDVARIEALMNEAARAAQTVVVASVFQPFTPQGVTGVVVVEESHLAIHTWPEQGYASLDIFTCGEGEPDAADRILRTGLQAQQAEVMLVERGLPADGPSMAVRTHRRDDPA